MLHASTAELEELAVWSRDIHASDHVAFALGYCGRKVGIAAAVWLADESVQALAGFRLATGFDGEADDVATWWSRHESKFNEGKRYLLGLELDLDVMKTSLRRADARLWAAHRLECLVSSQGRVYIPARGTPDRLLDAITALEPGSSSWRLRIDQGRQRGVGSGRA